MMILTLLSWAWNLVQLLEMLPRPYHAVQAKDLRERCDQRKINIP